MTGDGGQGTRRPSGRFGFTFVEIIFVTIVLGVLLAVSVPKFQQTAQRLRAEQAAFELTQLLRYAHERAVSAGETIAWVWDSDARTAHLEIIQQNGETVPLEGPANRSRPVPEDLTVSLTHDDTPNGHVRFFPDGTSESAVIALALREGGYTITIDATTSQVALATRSLAR